MKVTVTSGALAALERAKRELGGALPERMRNAVRQGAEHEKANKTYTDRTGDLRRSTSGRLERASANEVVVELVMDEEYASYVKRRGYSAIEEAARLTKETIADEIDAIGDRVTGA